MSDLPDARCNKEAFKELTSAFPKVLVLITSDECPACAYAEMVVEDAEAEIGKEAATLEVKVGKNDPECDLLLKDLAVTAVPTGLFYESGVEKKRMGFSGNPQKDLQQVKELVK